MCRAVMVTNGDIKYVGYRDAVLKAAKDLGISEYVSNLEPCDIELVVEGNKEQL